MTDKCTVGVAFYLKLLLLPLGDSKQTHRISVIAEKLLEPARTRAHVPVIFSIQETKSWDVPNLQLLGYVCYGCKFGLATLLVSDQFFKIRRSWRSEERWAAVLFTKTLW